MALIKCPECGQLITDTAWACPNCENHTSYDKFEKQYDCK